MITIAYVKIWDPVDRFLWGIAISIAVICSVVYILNARKRENNTEKLILYGFASMLIGFTLTRLFGVLEDLFIEGYYSDGIYYGDMDLSTSLFWRTVFGRLSMVSFSVGITLFMFSFERIFKHTRYIITGFYIILIVLINVIPNLDVRLIIYSVFIFMASVIFIPIILFFFTKWSNLEFKPIALSLCTGIILILLSIGNSEMYVKDLDLLPLWLSPASFIFGCAAIFFPPVLGFQVIHKPRILKAGIYGLFLGWIFLLTVTLFLLSLTGFNFVYSYIFFGCAYTITLLILEVRHIRHEIIKSESIKESSPNILEIFSKPKRVTEEEVSISKEKKVCLVCKNKLDRVIYLCPGCNSLYCVKCSEILSNEDNECWACSVPFDETKPSTRVDSDEEPTLVQEHKYKNKISKI